MYESALSAAVTNDDYLSSILATISTSNDYLSMYESALSAAVTTDGYLSSILYPTPTDTVTDTKDATGGNSSSQSSGGVVLSSGAIIGLAVGITGVTALGIAIWFCARHKRKTNATKAYRLMTSKRELKFEAFSTWYLLTDHSPEPSHLAHSSNASLCSQPSRTYGPMEAGGHATVHQGNSFQVINNYGHNPGVVQR